MENFILAIRILSQSLQSPSSSHPYPYRIRSMENHAGTNHIDYIARFPLNPVLLISVYAEVCLLTTPNERQQHITELKEILGDLVDLLDTNAMDTVDFTRQSMLETVHSTFLCIGIANERLEDMIGHTYPDIAGTSCQLDDS